MSTAADRFDQAPYADARRLASKLWCIECLRVVGLGSWGAPKAGLGTIPVKRRLREFDVTVCSRPMMPQLRHPLHYPSYWLLSDDLQDLHLASPDALKDSSTCSFDLL